VSAAEAGELDAGLSITLSDATWPAVDQWAAGTILALPLGATEQHGPHLPLGVDTVTANAIARGLAERRVDVTVAPALPYGASGEHAGFAGTLSIGTDVASRVLVELIRSADAYRGVLLVNAHGGNAEAVAAACRIASDEGRDVLSWAPSNASLATVARAVGGRTDAHAGWLETSIMLALSPASVRIDLAVAGNVRPIEELGLELRRHGVRSASPSGVLGDPSGSSAPAGSVVLQACIAELDALTAQRWGPAQERRASPAGGKSSAGPPVHRDVTARQNLDLDQPRDRSPDRC